MPINSWYAYYWMHIRSRFIFFNMMGSPLPSLLWNLTCMNCPNTAYPRAMNVRICRDTVPPGCISSTCDRASAEEGALHATQLNRLRAGITEFIIRSCIFWKPYIYIETWCRCFADACFRMNGEVVARCVCCPIVAAAAAAVPLPASTYTFASVAAAAPATVCMLRKF